MKTMKNRTYLITFCTLLVLAVSTLYGQTLRGRIEGTIKDPQGQVVPNTAISVKNTLTGESLTASSNNDGAFSVSEVKPGTYTITAELKGFKKSLVEGVVVQVGTVSSVIIQLEIGAISEEITVSMPMTPRLRSTQQTLR